LRWADAKVGAMYAGSLPRFFSEGLGGGCGIWASLGGLRFGISGISSLGSLT
jgi:hypothetical protein